MDDGTNLPRYIQCPVSGRRHFRRTGVESVSWLGYLTNPCDPDAKFQIMVLVDRYSKGQWSARVYKNGIVMSDKGIPGASGSTYTKVLLELASQIGACTTLFNDPDESPCS